MRGPFIVDAGYGAAKSIFIFSDASAWSACLLSRGNSEPSSYK